MEVNYKDPAIEIDEAMRKLVSFHASNPRFLTSFIALGLLPSPDGKNSWTPCCYSTPVFKECALSSYNWELVFPDGKRWILVLCLTGEKREGKAGEVRDKKNPNNWQYMFDPGDVVIQFLRLCYRSVIYRLVCCQFDNRFCQ